jgi:hypothetical protein
MVEKILVRRTSEGFEIVGNRRGLRGLAEVCAALADLPEDDEEAQSLLRATPS